MCFLEDFLNITGRRYVRGSSGYYQTFSGDFLTGHSRAEMCCKIFQISLTVFLSTIRFTVFSLYLYLEVDDSPHSSLAVT